MNKILTILLPIIIFIACKSDKEKSNEKFVALVENENINSFINVEYIIDGENETYHYFKGDTLFTSWEFDNTANRFENYNIEKMKVLSVLPTKYMELLKNKIKSLNIIMISQTQWHSQVIKFWTGDAEYFTYLHPDFKFDSAEKTVLKNELKNSDKINENWYHKKMKVCTNK